jgi:hypothetical protein
MERMRLLIPRCYGNKRSMKSSTQIFSIPHCQHPRRDTQSSSLLNHHLSHDKHLTRPPNIQTPKFKKSTAAWYATRLSKTSATTFWTRWEGDGSQPVSLYWNRIRLDMIVEPWCKNGAIFRQQRQAELNYYLFFSPSLDLQVKAAFLGR